MRQLHILIFVIACGLATAAFADDAIRVDASSNASAKASFDRMQHAASPAMRQQLAIALLKINLAGVMSAHEVVGNPELASMGIERVKDRVSGMTADEIVAYGEQVSTVRVENVKTER